MLSLTPRYLDVRESNWFQKAGLRSPKRKGLTTLNKYKGEYFADRFSLHVQ
jgi:hypothetical protein